ncbi:MAG: DNA (cytosine-5-)-methyltransferase [Nitrospiraceae bacterium]|nr:DNA (cytosine-5-)-methyltransferase [Nitrospiraceae bacterium]
MSETTSKAGSIVRGEQEPQRPILLVEDNAARSGRRELEVKGKNGYAPILIRLHRIVGETAEVLSEMSYKIGSLRQQHHGGRGSIALQLLDGVAPLTPRPLVVVGSAYTSNRDFLRGVSQRNLDFVAELRPSTQVEMIAAGARTLRRSDIIDVSKLLKSSSWEQQDIWLPQLDRSVQCRVAELGLFRLGLESTTRLFAVDVGAIDGFHRGTIIGASTDECTELANLIRALYWVRWIRPLVRRRERTLQKSPNLSNRDNLALKYRSNIALARLQDQSRSETVETQARPTCARGLLAGSTVLNVAELFAGAGGMGLGFLMARALERSFRLLFSGELHPIYAETLRLNHQYFARKDGSYRSDPVPESVRPIDLNKRKAMDQVVSTARESGGVDVLIGGPPCRGFSSANRNSWSSNNPHNRLVNIFMRYVEKLRPPVFLMENVQGIVWTATNGSAKARTSVAEHISRRMRAAGYLVFPKLLDAVWYGVPQYRTRFFVLGIHTDVGYRAEDFGSWGPFPTPTHGPVTGCSYVTVRDAMGDLPSVGNGHGLNELQYSEPSPRVLAVNTFLRQMRLHAPKHRVLDHVTSQHADYVIERYKRILPGRNWQDIVDMMSNYAAVERTHSNIYRRLEWDKPSITIGHYRKSMLVHPNQHRGLSLREACRLQSLPDWFRFAGTEDGRAGGLMHKQQQLANAVCPLLSKSIAGFILEL